MQTTMKTYFTRIFAAVIILSGSITGLKAQDKSSLMADGPYIVYDSLGCGATIVSISAQGTVHRQHVESLPSNYTFKVTSSDLKHTFNVKLHNIHQPRWNYSQPSRMFITSDPHANFDCLYTLLLGNGVIDRDCNWAYGDGHLTLIGDIADRGTDATTIYWLMYKLEAEAAAAGGAVHFMIGNHEPLVLMNDLRYTAPSYLMLADTLGIKYGSLFSPHSELGRWLLSRNTIERVGRNIMVHAGLSRELYDTGLSIPEINALMPAGLYKRKSQRKSSGSLIYLLHGSNGPIWYRGLVRDDKKYNPIASDTLTMILDRFEADRIIVGHTIFDEPRTFHEGRVIGVNVDNKKNREAGRGRAVLMENDVFWIVDERGKMRRLSPAE